MARFFLSIRADKPKDLAHNSPRIAWVKTGNELRICDGGPGVGVYAVVLDAANHATAERVARSHFVNPVVAYCSPKPADWRPASPQFFAHCNDAGRRIVCEA